MSYQISWVFYQPTEYKGKPQQCTFLTQHAFPQLVSIKLYPVLSIQKIYQFLKILTKKLYT